MDGITTVFLSLQGIIFRLKDDLSLSPARRRDLISAVLRICEIVGIDPKVTPASLQYMRPLINKVRPAKHELRPKTWANLRSNFRAALAQAQPRLLERQIDPAWRRLRTDLPDQRMKAGLSRFINYCEREQIAPEAACDAAFDRFLAELDADTLVPSPRDCHRRACRLWNEAVDRVPGWPGVRVSVPPPQIVRRTLPLSSYPERVRKEFELCISPPRGHRFAQHGHQKKLRRATVTQKKVLIELALFAAVEAGTDSASITTLDYLFEPHVFQAILERYCEDDEAETPRPTAHNLAGTLIGLAKQRLGSSPAALDRIAELRGLQRCLGPQAQGLTEKNQRLLRELSDPATLARLLLLPERLAAWAPRTTQARGALAMELAVAIAILLIAPMRISNLAGLHLKQHLVRPGGSRSLLLIDIPPEQVKNEVRLLYQLSQRVTRVVDRFVRDFRPRFAKPDNPYLFPVGVTHKTPNWLSRQIRQVIADWVGIDMTPHQFRHLAGMLMQRNSPGSFAALAQLLGHKKIDTVIRYYAELDALSAGREFDAIVEGELTKAYLPRRGR
jgi:site-specific recombinase XerD